MICCGATPLNTELSYIGAPKGHANFIYNHRDMEIAGPRWCSGLAYRPVASEGTFAGSESVTRVRMKPGRPSCLPVFLKLPAGAPSPSFTLPLRDSGEAKRQRGPVAQHGRAPTIGAPIASVPHGKNVNGDEAFSVLGRNQVVVGPNPTGPAMAFFFQGKKNASEKERYYHDIDGEADCRAPTSVGRRPLWEPGEVSPIQGPAIILTRRFWRE